MPSSTDRAREGGRAGDPAAGALAVVVPARNEEERIGDCLQSLCAAADYLRATDPRAPAVHLVVVLDDCSDGTAAIAAANPRVRMLPVRHRRVGAARRAGVDFALRLSAGTVGWLASTDADSMVPPDWLTTMVALARAGADLVLGTVVPAPGLPAAVARRHRERYRFVDGHRHVHGANLGIGMAAYRAVGGWPAVACHEDAMLVRCAERAGLVIARTGAIPVRTSSRLVGRAPAGFAAHLAALATFSPA
jgi:hypothetical protein